MEAKLRGQPLVRNSVMNLIQNFFLMKIWGQRCFQRSHLLELGEGLGAPRHLTCVSSWGRSLGHLVIAGGSAAPVAVAVQARQSFGAQFLAAPLNRRGRLQSLHC